MVTIITLKLILLWDIRIWEIIQKNIPMSVSSKSKVDHHLFQNCFSLARTNQTDHHVLECKMLSPKFSSNQWDMRLDFITKCDASLVMFSKPVLLQIVLESRLEY